MLTNKVVQTNKTSNKNQFIEKLRSLIKDGDEVDRCYAIRALSDLQDSGSATLIIESMRDEDLDVCIDAVNALGVIGKASNATVNEKITDKLIESLINDPESEIKVACLESLAQIGNKKAIPHFLKIAEERPEEMNFDSGDWDVWWDMQLQSIRGLGKLKVDDAVPVLQKLIEADDYHDIENEIFNAIVEIEGEKSDEYLLSLLTDGNPRIKRRVAKALGKSQSKSTLKLLARSLQDKASDVREATLSALSERGATQYLPAILLSFRDSNADVRNAAVKAAHHLNQQIKKDDSHADELIEKLVPVLYDTDQTVKATVLDTLLNLGWQAEEKEIEYLSEQLKSCTGDCFSALCRIITAQKLADGYANLLYLLQHNELETEEKIHALGALGKSGQWNSAIESTIGILIFDDKAVVRLAALEALANLDSQHPADSAYEGRLPIDMISETLQGQLKPPATHKIIPIVPVEDIEKKFALNTESNAEKNAENTKHADKNASQESDNLSETVLDKTTSDKGRETVDTSFMDDALQQISQSIADGEKPLPLSTLDSIAITHIEDELEKTAAKKKQQAEITKQEEAEKEQLKDFIALTDDNREISQWLLNKESIDVNVDIKRLAARILGQVGSSSTFPLLLKAFDTDDSELKREVALSITELLKNGTASIENTELKTSIHTALSQELNTDKRDLRIAIARALAELGSIDDIPALIEKLFDDDIAMRIQTLHSLSKIACCIDDQNNKSESGQSVNYAALAELMLDQLKENKFGIHRAAVEALIPLFESKHGNKLNGSTVSLKQKAISRLIQAGLSGTHGQVQDMSWGLKALDKELSSISLLEKIDEVSSSVERRYMIEMLGELHKESA